VHIELDTLMNPKGMLL